LRERRYWEEKEELRKKLLEMQAFKGSVRVCLPVQMELPEFTKIHKNVGY